MTDPFAPNAGWGNYALEGLSEIELPAAIDLIPQTVGWWGLLLAVLYWLGKQLYTFLKRYWRNRYRRIALQQLNDLKLAGNTAQLHQLPAIIKATALKSFPRSEIANLYGDDWEAFLDNSYNGPSFAKEFPGCLYTLSYQSTNNTDLTEQFWQQCQLWISTHRSAYD